MDLNLRNKVFIVTGGSKGIGEAITRTLTDEGAAVMIATRSEKATISLVNELNTRGKQVIYSIEDLSNKDACEAAVNKTVTEFGRIDGIVNNAGFNDGAGLEKGPDAFRNSLQVNLYHYFDMVYYALPWLKKSKGSIVNISSKVALTGQGHTSGYAAAKGAQLALTREWAADLLPWSIRVNAVIPAEVMTPLYRKWLDQNFTDPGQKEKEITSRIPLDKRMTTAEEISAMTVFLLSDKSAHTTGQFLIVDGGYTHLDRTLT